METITFHSTGFYILDTVPEKDMQTGRGLEENIVDIINTNNSSLYCKRIKCTTENDVLDALKSIKTNLIENGDIPYIHIEGHGSKDSLALPSGSVFSWNKLFELFREINILCKNNLFVSSGACLSAYGYKAASITEACPVFGLLAPEKVINSGGVKDGYHAFFKSLICNESLNEAFNRFSEATNGKDYALIFSQLMFRKAAYNYITVHCMGKNKRERLEELVTQATTSTDVSVNAARKQLKKEIYGPQAKHLSKYHQKFMMIDKYPENAERFEFNAGKFEQDVRNGKIKYV